MVAESSTPATASADKLRIDTAWRTAGALDPERFGNKSQLGVSGGLILAAGSLADLAAQAAQLHTNDVKGVTQGAKKVLSSPDNLTPSENLQSAREVTEK
jgi:hypothetical protein